MHDMQTIVADVHGACLSACPSVCHAGLLGAVDAAFAKSLWPLAFHS